MDKPTAERLHVLSRAWRKNIAPRFQGEFDAFLPLLDDRGAALTTTAKVTWNALRDRYEMEPVIEVSSTAYSLTELQLTEENFQRLELLLGRLGIHTMHRVRIQGTVEPKVQPNLPRSCWPTIIGG